MDPEQEAEFRKGIGSGLGDYQAVIFGMGCGLFEYKGGWPDHLNYLEKIETLHPLGTWERVYAGSSRGKRILYVISPPGAPELANLCEYYLCHGPAEMGIGLGIAGSVSNDIKPGDLVMPSLAIIGEGTSVAYGYKPGDCVPSYAGLEHVIRGNIYTDNLLRGHFFTGETFTTDGFCTEDGKFLEKVRVSGAIAVDMETSALFSVSRQHDKHAAALLVISDKIEGDNPHRIDHVPEIVYQNFKKAVRIASEALFDSF